MSVYRVNEGATLLWPGGIVRAESGELFEGFEDVGRPAGRDFASALLWESRAKVTQVADEVEGEVRCDMPADVLHTFTFFNGSAPEGPKPKPKPKKKASAKKTKAAEADKTDA